MMFNTSNIEWTKKSRKQRTWTIEQRAEIAKRLRKGRLDKQARLASAK